MHEFRALLESLTTYFAGEVAAVSVNTEKFGTIGREDVPRLLAILDKPAHERMLRDCAYLDGFTRRYVPTPRQMADAQRAEFERTGRVTLTGYEYLDGAR